MIYLGLNAFVRNLSHFVGIKVPDKLQKLLSCIRDATKLCVKFDFFDQEDSIVVVSACNHWQDSQFLRLFEYFRSLWCLKSTESWIKFNSLILKSKKYERKNGTDASSSQKSQSLVDYPCTEVKKWRGENSTDHANRRFVIVLFEKNSLPFGVFHLRVCVCVYRFRITVNHFIRRIETLNQVKALAMMRCWWRRR